MSTESHVAGSTRSAFHSDQEQRLHRIATRPVVFPRHDLGQCVWIKTSDVSLKPSSCSDCNRCATWRHQPSVSRRCGCRPGCRRARTPCVQYICDHDRASLNPSVLAASTRYAQQICPGIPISTRLVQPHSMDAAICAICVPHCRFWHFVHMGSDVNRPTLHAISRPFNAVHRVSFAHGAS